MRKKRPQCTILFTLALLFSPLVALAQTSLILASGAAVAGSPVSLNLSLSSPSGMTVSALEWTVTYPASASNISVSAGPALTAAGKTLTCAAVSAGYSCVATGMNANAIANGVIATVSGTVSGSAAINIGISGATASTPGGEPSSVAATSGTVIVSAPITMGPLACNPASLNPGAEATCTVTLSGPTGSSGAQVTLATTGSIGIAANSLAIAAGSGSGTFTATAGQFSSNQTATVTASLNGSSSNASISLVAPPLISSLQCAAPTLASNASTSCTVTLTSAAPTGGASVAIAGAIPNVLTLPASVTVPATATTASFTATTSAISSAQTATVTASLNGSSESATLSLTVPVLVSSLQCAAATLTSNTSTSCTVTLSGAAPTGGISITISGAIPNLLTLPASVTVPAGATTASFTASAGTISSTQATTITASLNSSSKAAASLSLTAPEAISSITCGASVLSPQTSTSCTVTLTQPVPSGSSASVSVSSSNPILIVSQSGLTVAAGTSSVVFTAQAGAFSSNQTASLSATLNGNSKAFTISLTAFGSLSFFACTPLTVAPGGSGSCSVVLSAPLPAPSTVVLTASSAALSAPSSVTIPSGAVSASVNYTIGTTLTGWPTITASFGGVSRTIVITVTTSAAAATPALAGKSHSTGHITPIALSCDYPFLAGGHRMGCELQLNAPSPTGSVEIALANSARNLTMPATIGVRAGQSRIRFEVAADPAAPQEAVTLEARIGSESVRSSLALLPSDTPNLIVPSETAGTPRSPIRFTVAASDPQGLGVNLAASGLPAGAVFDANSGVLQWLPTNRDLGVHDVVFTATNTLGAATSKTVKLYVDSGQPVAATLENGAGSSAPAGCSPGSVATIRGRSLFNGAVTASDRSGSSDNLGGTRARVNGSYATLLFASANRVDLLCPANMAGTPLVITVETASGKSNELHSVMQVSAPGLLTADGSGTGQALAAQTGSLDIAAVPNARFSSKPALPGDTVSFLATGIDCSPQTASNLNFTVGQDRVSVIGLKPLAGHAGICEIQAPIPGGVIGDAVPVTLLLVQGNGLEVTSNQTTIGIAAQR